MRWKRGNVCTINRVCIRNTTANVKVSHRRDEWEEIVVRPLEDCRNVKCPDETICTLVKNTGEPMCYPKKHCQPSRSAEPLCGTDGVTYPHSCAMRLNVNPLGRTPELAHRGRCGERRTSLLFIFSSSNSTFRIEVSTQSLSAVRTLRLFERETTRLYPVSISATLLHSQWRMQHERRRLWRRRSTLRQLLFAPSKPMPEKSVHQHRRLRRMSIRRSKSF